MGEYYLPGCAHVTDAALSGRSSKSFYEEGAWAAVEVQLRAGDFVLIQFAHNDEKSEDPTRYTDPESTYPEFLTRYVQETRAKGATPILLTPINRNNWSDGEIADTHGAYPDAMRALATREQVALVDATSLTKAHFERLGQAETNELFMNLPAGAYPNYPNGNEDNTHLKEAGARVVLQLVISDLRRQALPPGLLTREVVSAP